MGFNRIPPLKCCLPCSPQLSKAVNLCKRDVKSKCSMPSKREAQEKPVSDLTSELAFELTQHNNFLRGMKKKILAGCFVSCNNKVIYDKLFAQHTPPWEDLSPHPWLPLCLHNSSSSGSSFCAPSFLPFPPNLCTACDVEGQTLL